MSDASPQPDPTPDEYALRPAPPHAAPAEPATELPLTLEEIRQRAEGRPQFSLRDLLLLTAATALFLRITTHLLPNPATFAGALGLLCLAALLVRPFIRTRSVLVDLALWILLGMYVLACLRGIIEYRPPIQ
jgi:hypothetical protein